MDTKKQGFFSALREEVARGLSPGRARRWSASNAAEVAAALCRLSGAGEALAPLMEGPDPEACPSANCSGARSEGWGQWVRGQLQLARAAASAGTDPERPGPPPPPRPNDLRLLLGVMGAPLAPVRVCASEPLPHLSINDTPPSLPPPSSTAPAFDSVSGQPALPSAISPARCAAPAVTAAVQRRHQWNPSAAKPKQRNLGAGGLLSGDAGVFPGGATLGGIQVAANGHLDEFSSTCSSWAP